MGKGKKKKAKAEVEVIEPEEPAQPEHPLTPAVLELMNRWEGVGTLYGRDDPELEPHELIWLFSYLIRGSHAFRLQGYYGRMAFDLRAQRLVDNHGNPSPLALQLYPQLNGYDPEAASGG